MEDDAHIDIDKSRCNNKVGASITSKLELKKNDTKQKGTYDKGPWKEKKKATSSTIDWAKANKELDKLISSGEKFDEIIFTGHGSSGWMAGITSSDLQSGANGQPTDAYKFLQKLQKLLNPNSSIDIRHCSVASGQSGKDFVQEMADLMGAKVTAIDDWYAIWPHGTEWTATPGGNGPTAGNVYPPYPGYPKPRW